MILPVLSARKNLVLLVAIVAAAVAQPLLGHRSVAAGAFFDAVFTATCCYVLSIVFTDRWERRIALGAIVVVVAGDLAHYVLPPWGQVPSAVTFHCAVVLFLTLAVAAILRDIVQKRVVRGDDVAGALCGYLLGALVWANVYAMTYVLAPATFSVKAELTRRLEQWHGRRALFDYLSFTTLTSLGYGDIAPAGPPVYSFMWLEVIFGQFYMAVVVAQLVGHKLAGAIKDDRP